MNFGTFVNIIGVFCVVKEILGLGDGGHKMTDITKKYLAAIWRKRKLNQKRQKNYTAENKNSKSLETEKTQLIKNIFTSIQMALTIP